MANQNDDNIKDAQIVEDTNTPSDPNGGEVLINLEALIKSHISNIDKTKDDLKKHKEMLDSILDNDTVYKEHSEKAKEANKIKSQTRSQIMKQPQAADLNQKIKDMRQSLKALQLALSDYLREFQRMSGSNEIEGDDGEVREIVYTVKLIKKSSRF